MSISRILSYGKGIDHLFGPWVGNLFISKTTSNIVNRNFSPDIRTHPLRITQLDDVVILVSTNFVFIYKSAVRH